MKEISIHGAIRNDGTVLAIGTDKERLAEFMEGQVDKNQIALFAYDPESTMITISVKTGAKFSPEVRHYTAIREAMRGRREVPEFMPLVLPAVGILIQEITKNRPSQPWVTPLH